MTRSSFLLLDANIVIQLFKSGAWQQFAANAQIQIARTVLGEAHYFENEHGERVDFDLNVDVAAGVVDVVEVGLRELERFLNQFDPSYAEKLDPGEAESLAYLIKAPRETRICSADAIVFRVLGNLDRGEQGGGDDPRALMILKDVECADQCDHGAGRTTASPSANRGPRSEPTGMRSLLSLAALASLGSVLSVVLLPQALSVLGWVQAPISAACLYFCWSALHRKRSGFRGLLALLGVNALLRVFALEAAHTRPPNEVAADENFASLDRRS